MTCRSFTLACAFSALTFLLTSDLASQTSQSPLDTLRLTKVPFDSLIMRFRAPELERRKEERRVIQRRAYAEALFEVTGGENVLGLLSYLKGLLQLRYWLNQPTLYITPPNPRFGIRGVPIPEDWSWPEDPWKRE